MSAPEKTFKALASDLASAYRAPQGDDFDERGTEAQLAALYAALARAQGAFEAFGKGEEVSIKSEKGSYRFRYATLDEIIRATRPALTANGLAVSMPPAGGSVRLILSHEGGGRLVVTHRFQAKPNEKDYGGQLTYLRRYLYSATLNVAADEDLESMPETSRGETAAESRKVDMPARAPKELLDRVQANLRSLGATNMGQARSLAAPALHGEIVEDFSRLTVEQCEAVLALGGAK